MDKDDERQYEEILEIICGEKMVGAIPTLLSMKKDAERYRWLRENDWDSPIVKLDYDDYHTLKGAELDAAIDAMILPR